MIMVIVQALCDADLTAPNNQLASAADSLRLGILYAGQLHIGEKFPHEQRIATFIAVQRG